MGIKLIILGWTTYWTEFFSLDKHCHTVIIPGDLNSLYNESQPQVNINYNTAAMPRKAQWLLLKSQHFI